MKPRVRTGSIGGRSEVGIECGIIEDVTEEYQLTNKIFNFLMLGAHDKTFFFKLTLKTLRGAQ